MKLPLILASASPRRANILADLGLEFTVYASDVEEQKWNDIRKQIPIKKTFTKEERYKQKDQRQQKDQRFLAAIQLVKTNAVLKGRSVYRKHPKSICLAADTVVFCNAEVFEKPKDRLQALEMFTAYQNHTAQVLTALSLHFPNKNFAKEEAFDCRVECTTMHTHKYSIPLQKTLFEMLYDKGKSGGFSIEGKGALLFDNLKGSFYNVLGLPVHLLLKMMEDNRFDLFA